MLQYCLREDVYCQGFVDVWREVAFQKETEGFRYIWNLSSFIIADIVSGVFIFGVSLSFLSICILFAAFCKLPAAGLPRGFAGPGCCFCMLSKAATCALRLGRSLKSLISANIAFIPRFR